MSTTVMHFCHPVPDFRFILQLHHRRSVLAAVFHSLSMFPVVFIIDFSGYDFMRLVERVVYESSVYTSESLSRAAQEEKRGRARAGACQSARMGASRGPFACL